jgi:hypothetical protein
MGAESLPQSQTHIPAWQSNDILQAWQGNSERCCSAAPPPMPISFKKSRRGIGLGDMFTPVPVSWISDSIIEAERTKTQGANA